MKMESQEDGCVLSEDNIYEIMTRVALLSLPSCLRVCRSWRRIGYLSCFGEAHSLRTTSAFGFILQNFDRNEYHHAFVPMHNLYAHPLPFSSLPSGRAETLNIEASAPTHNILFCNIITKDNSKNNIRPRYYITRFGATPYNLQIPNPKTSFDTCGIAIFFGAHNIDRTTYDFKIVRISSPRWGPTQVPSINYCEILDSKAKKWRRSKDLPSLWLINKTSIVIKQIAYWIMDDYMRTRSRSYSVFAFNVEEEKGRIIKGPEITFITSNQVYYWRMIPYQERLCLVYMSEENINVWMMVVGTSGENSHRWEWKGSYSAHYIKNYKFTFEDSISNQEVVLLETLHIELWYDLHQEDVVRYMFSPRSIFRISMDENF